MAEGLFLLRAVVGLLLVAHGTQKLLGWFGGHGVEGTGGFFEQVGHRPGRLMATIAGLSEAGGGALLVLGLLTPFGAAAVIGVMTVASVSVHGDKGIWATNGGYELPMLYAVAAAALAFTGPGGFSIDSAAGLHLSGWLWGIGAILLGLIGAALQLFRRDHALSADSAYPAGTAGTAEEAGDPAMAGETATRRS